jgi:SAM-dependent methyltransferase
MRLDDNRRTPAYLYRHRLYRRVLGPLGAPRFLEVGAGRGELAAWLAGRGGRGVALEPSPYAAAAARVALESIAAVDVVEADLGSYRPEGDFQLVTIMEILEHVEDDGAMVNQAAGMLGPEGRLVVSVPAHARMWGWRDEEKGHLRRYERDGLIKLLGDAGLAVESLLCWGWPVINLLRFFGRGRRAERGDVREATALSAVKQDVNLGPSWLLASFVTAVPFGIMDIFLGMDWGVGYIAVARKGPSV